MKTTKGVELPEDFYEELMNNKEALTVLEMMPPSHQTEYARHIEEAKKEETRKKRIAGSIEQILEYGKNKKWIP